MRSGYVSPANAQPAPLSWIRKEQSARRAPLLRGSSPSVRHANVRVEINTINAVPTAPGDRPGATLRLLPKFRRGEAAQPQGSADTPVAIRPPPGVLRGQRQGYCCWRSHAWPRIGWAAFPRAAGMGLPRRRNRSRRAALRWRPSRRPCPEVPPDRLPSNFDLSTMSPPSQSGCRGAADTLHYGVGVGARLRQAITTKRRVSRAISMIIWFGGRFPDRVSLLYKDKRLYRHR